MRIFWKIITQGWSEFFLPIQAFIFWYWTKNLSFAVNFVLVWIICDTIASTIKLLYFTDRPQKMEYNNFITKTIASSFPSIHAARSCSVFLFSTLLGIIPTILYFIYFVAVSYSRVFLQKHFWRDIFWWIILASVVFIIYLHFFWDNDLVFWILKNILTFVQ